MKNLPKRCPLAWLDFPALPGHLNKSSGINYAKVNIQNKRWTTLLLRQSLEIGNSWSKALEVGGSWSTDLCVYIILYVLT